MSAFSGSQGKGARRRLRELKRAEAELRNERTPMERTRRFRRTVHAALGKAVAK